MNDEKAIDQLKDMQSRCKNGYDAEAINIAIKAVYIVDIINKELSPADEDKAIWFDSAYFEEIQERAEMRVRSSYAAEDRWRT